MTSSLMVAINKAKENGPGARIALINPHEIATMYYIPGICARVKATGQANFKNYKGDHEYWAWLQVSLDLNSPTFTKNRNSHSRYHHGL